MLASTREAPLLRLLYVFIRMKEQREPIAVKRFLLSYKRLSFNVHALNFIGEKSSLMQIVALSVRERKQAVAKVEAAMAAVAPAMHLLARMTAAEPALAVSLVQMRLPAPLGPPGSAADASADLLSLVAAALSVLPQLHAFSELRRCVLSVLGAHLHSMVSTLKEPRCLFGCMH